MGSLFGSRGPSASEVAAKQEAAAKKEREKIAQEEAIATASKQKELQDAYAQTQSDRQSFVSNVKEDEESSRRKFLKGV